MRRHFEGAQLEQAQVRSKARRRKELVDAELGAMGVPGDIGEQVAEQSIHDIRVDNRRKGDG